jgi:hypothetical protein
MRRRPGGACAVVSLRAFPRERVRTGEVRNHSRPLTEGYVVMRTRQ